MAYGLKVWNSTGKVQVDSEAGITRLIATYTVTMKGSASGGSGVSSFTQSVTGMAPNTKWAVFLTGPSVWEGAPQDVIKTTIYSGYFTAEVMDIYVATNTVYFTVIQT